MTELSEKLNLFLELLHCAAPVSFWHYDHKMNLVSCDSPQQELFHTLFAISEYRLEVYKHCQTMDVPAMKRFVKCFFELLTKTFRRGGKRGRKKGAKCTCGRLKAIFAGR